MSVALTDRTSTSRSSSSTWWQPSSSSTTSRPPSSRLPRRRRRPDGPTNRTWRCRGNRSTLRSPEPQPQPHEVGSAAQNRTAQHHCTRPPASHRPTPQPAGVSDVPAGSPCHATTVALERPLPQVLRCPGAAAVPERPSRGLRLRPSRLVRMRRPVSGAPPRAVGHLAASDGRGHAGRAEDGRRHGISWRCHERCGRP